MKKSKGHIAFVGDFEYYTRGGEIYRAKTHNAFDLEGYRHGRWEGPDRPSTYTGLIQQTIDAVKKFGGGDVIIDKKYKRQLKEDTMSDLAVYLEAMRRGFGEASSQRGLFTGDIPMIDKIWDDGFVSEIKRALSRYKVKIVKVEKYEHGRLPALRMTSDNGTMVIVIPTDERSLDEPRAQMDIRVGRYISGTSWHGGQNMKFDTIFTKKPLSTGAEIAKVANTIATKGGERGTKIGWSA